MQRRWRGGGDSSVVAMVVELGEIAPCIARGERARRCVASVSAITGYDGLPFGGVKIRFGVVQVGGYPAEDRADDWDGFGGGSD